jgi:glycosyltransferase involved in cell wall biosynthesis
VEVLALQALGHQVTVCTYHNGEDIEGLHIVRTPSIPWRRHYEVGSSLHKIAFDILLSLTSLDCALRQKPDVIHAHLHEGALIGYPLSRLWRIPLVFDFQGSLTGEMIDHGFLSPNSRFRGPLRRFEELIDRLPTTTIVSSQHAARLLCEEFACEEQRIHILPDAVDTDLFCPGGSQEEKLALKRSLGIPADTRLVVYLGLLAEYQGTSLLLKAARQLADTHEDAHFLIMGHPNEEYYRALAAKLGITEHVTFTGRIHYLQAHRYLGLGHVAVGPKISATEGSGKLPNYMAMALPSVAFDTPVNREYLGDWGTYSEAVDHRSLAQSIASLLEDKALAAELGARLRERAVQLYSLTTFREKLKSIYSLAFGEA